jgi:hypothetical protein
MASSGRRSKRYVIVGLGLIVSMIAIQTTASAGHDSPDNDWPDCSKVFVTPSVLWPPNHQFVEVTVGGAVDPDGDALTYSMRSVDQDEPLQSAGDRTSPDARRTSDPRKVLLRAERSTSGDGRVYQILLDIEDPHGHTCNEGPTISVPRTRNGPPAHFSGLTANSFGE